MEIILAKKRGFCANTYFVTADGKNAVVIDPAHAGVADELRQRGLRPIFILLTHCHFDHVAGVSAVQALGAKVLCSTQEKQLVGTSCDLFERFGAKREPYAIDETLNDGEIRELCGLTVQTLLTAGHTAGSVCYLIRHGVDTALFTGDTLFAGTIGRTDFPTGDMAQLRNSLKKLYNLQGDYSVYPGHEEFTSLENERKCNPFMCDL